MNYSKLNFTDGANIKQNKRPLFITVFAILILLMILSDMITVITLNKEKYKADIKNSETLIKDGQIIYRNIPVYWAKQSDFAKNRIVKQLNTQKIIVSKFSLYRIFKLVFIFSSILLFYGLWKLKKWIYIVIIIEAIFGVMFNGIFMFIPFVYDLLDMILYLLLFVWMWMKYKIYFIN